MKVITQGGKPLLSGGRFLLTPGSPCVCGDCGSGTGACCPEDGSDCYITTLSECTSSNGTFQGTGSNCNGVNCTNGACCPEDGSDCYITSLSDCDSANGTFYGNGTNCVGINCTLTGACCVGTDCSIETEADCIGMAGTYQGDNTNCSPNPCDVGACCIGGVCSIETSTDCAAAGGHYLGSGSTCAGVDCTKGQCCHGGACSTTTEAACSGAGGVFSGYGTDCAGNCCKCFHNPVDGLYYCNKVVHATATGSNPGGCDCTLTADWTSTFTCDPDTGTVIPTCSGTWHKVVSLTLGHICVPSDVTETWALFSGVCGWNSSHANPVIDCCAGMGSPNPCGVAGLDTFTSDCSYTCCDAQPGCFVIDVTVTYF